MTLKTGPRGYLTPRGRDYFGQATSASSSLGIERECQSKQMTALAAHQAYLAQVLDRQSIRRSLVDPNHTFPLQQEVKGYLPRLHQNAEAGPSKRHVVNYVEEEETVRNDLAERYVQSGEFGSNYILGASAQEICEE
jgi:hypothetical protein